MNTPNKAPVGGIVSAVNGQFYDGGRFTPVTGEFCGRGRNRVAKSALSAINSIAKLQDAEIFFNDIIEQFQLVRWVTLRDGTRIQHVFFTAASVKTLEKLL